MAASAQRKQSQASTRRAHEATLRGNGKKQAASLVSPRLTAKSAAVGDAARRLAELTAGMEADAWQA